MCWETDYRFFAEQKKAQETQVKQERRTQVIDRLLNDANPQAEDTKVEAPSKESISAK